METDTVTSDHTGSSSSSPGGQASEGGLTEPEARCQRAVFPGGPGERLFLAFPALGAPAFLGSEPLPHLPSQQRGLLKPLSGSGPPDSVYSKHL